MAPWVVLQAVVWALLCDIGACLQCYQCDSQLDIDCAELDPEDTDLQPQPCDHLYDAQYCIKTSGTYGGDVGTKRFCSAHDLGDYCKYIMVPGEDSDDLSCIYSCSSDACNPGRRLSPDRRLLTVLAMPLLAILRRR